MSVIITLLTDFGTRDAYVASMKGVMLGITPDATIVDISHEIAAQDVIGGAWVLGSACRHFPRGTVHCAVIDPGVGSERRAVAVQAGDWRFVGPDNGLLMWAIAMAGRYEAVELVDPRYFRREVSATFHGRDIFAPVAAHLARGVPLDALGPRIADLAPLPFPSPIVTTEAIEGEVVHVDRFGNLITNIDASSLELWGTETRATVEVGGRRAPLRRTYQDAGPGELIALIESTGHVEVAVRDGNAAVLLEAGRGVAVTIHRG